MHFFCLIVFSTLLASVKPDDIDPTPPPVKAKATVSLGKTKLFSGEDVQMTCSVPDDPLPNWTYEWFHNGRLVSSVQVYNLQKARLQHAGDYTCQGEKGIKEWPYIVKSTPSDPLKIHIDGGWVLLQTPAEPLIVEEAMTLTCQVRDNPLLLDVVFYKNDMEVTKQTDKNLVYPSVTLKDADSYSCRATWVKNMEYQSGQSLPSPVIVLDKLETPKIEFSPSLRFAREGDSVGFRCITKVNAREPDLSMEYYYFKDGSKLGPASAQDEYTIKQVIKDDAGFYTCKVLVRALEVERMSGKIQLRVLSRLQV